MLDIDPHNWFCECGEAIRWEFGTADWLKDGWRKNHTGDGHGPLSYEEWKALPRGVGPGKRFQKTSEEYNA